MTNAEITAELLQDANESVSKSLRAVSILGHIVREDREYDLILKKVVDLKAALSRKAVEYESYRMALEGDKSLIINGHVETSV